MRPEENDNKAFGGKTPPEAAGPALTGTQPHDAGQTVNQQVQRRFPWWVHPIGYLVTLLLGGSGAVLFGVWDRLADIGPPIAKIHVTFPEGEAPLMVVISAAESSDPDGREMTYKWEIDGTTVDNSQMTFQHTFNERRNHLVTLEVTDSAGLTSTAAEDVVIRDNFKPSHVVAKIDSAAYSIRSGSFDQTLDALNRWRYTCVERSIRPNHCAQLHEWAGEAEAYLGRMDSALDSMRKAVAQMPGNQFFVVNLAEIHLLRNEPADAIEVLNELGLTSPLGAPASLAMGISHAMIGDHATANTYLGRVVGGKGTPTRAAARFAQLVNQALADQTDNSFSAQDLTDSVCTDRSLGFVFHGNKPWMEMYIRTVRLLVERLGSNERTQLQHTMRLIKCS